MAEFDPAIDNTLKWEGGLVDGPADPGGLTNFGLSQRTYPSLDIRNLTQDEAKAIYLRDWWQPHPFDQIVAQAIANKVFDMAVNMGTHAAFKLLQICVGASPDGVFGPTTLTSTNQHDPDRLLLALRSSSSGYYLALATLRPSSEKFLNGWLKRAAS